MAIDAINEMRIDILTPVMIGAVVGLIAFSHILSWVFKKYKNQTLAVLTGFILGSLAIIWPWKDPIIEVFGGKEKAIGWAYNWPPMDLESLIAFAIIIIGILSIWLMEKSASKIEKETS